MTAMHPFYGPLDLADWRRRIAALYAAVRDSGTPVADRHARFWSERDALFRTHPASPLEPDRREGYEGAPRFPYDPDLRFTCELEPASGARALALRLRDDGELTLRPAYRVSFRRGSRTHGLVIYALGGYGGGLFLPFVDETSGTTTYGGGRYLLDTAKHADLGESVGSDGGRRIVLDFNFAYHPSCVYSDRWDCPLAPPENRLAASVEAGERLPAAYDA